MTNLYDVILTNRYFTKKKTKNYELRTNPELMMPGIETNLTFFQRCCDDKSTANLHVKYCSRGEIHIIIDNFLISGYML